MKLSVLQRRSLVLLILVVSVAGAVRICGTAVGAAGAGGGNRHHGASS